MDGAYASHRLRQGRVCEPGRIYHVRFSIHPGSQTLSTLSLARPVVRGLMATETQVETLCFVVMPDHVHWLLRLNEGQDLSAAVQKARSLATRNIRQLVGYESFAWQPGFFDRALRRDEDIAAVARYIVANPVRAGLVKSVRDYSSWDAVWFD